MKLIVMRVDKHMTTKECIAHAKKIKEELGYNVLLVDKKVSEVSTIEIDENLILGDYILVEGKIYKEIGDDENE